MNPSMAGLINSSNLTCIVLYHSGIALSELFYAVESFPEPASFIATTTTTTVEADQVFQGGRCCKASTMPAPAV